MANSQQVSGHIHVKTQQIHIPVFVVFLKNLSTNWEETQNLIVQLVSQMSLSEIMIQGEPRGPRTQQPPHAPQCHGGNQS